MDKEALRAALKEAIYQRRSTRFYVITNTEKRAGLRKAVTEALSDTAEQEAMSQHFRALIRRARQGEVDVTYGAPVLIITSNRKGSHNAVADCSCALQNMMLTAAAYGIGNCWINQFFLLRDKKPVIYIK